MQFSEIEFDADVIAAGIARWASVESPSYDRAAVNRMMDVAETDLAALGAAITRFPGEDGFADVVKADFTFGDGPPVMILGHLVGCVGASGHGASGRHHQR